jgi:uncharacterized protein
MSLKINTVKLDNAGVDYKGSLAPADLDLEAIPNRGEIVSLSEARYAFHASMVRGSLLISGNLSVVCECVCGRCLENFEMPLEGIEACHYYDDTSVDEIDVAPDLREDILVALPSNPLCSPECQGLCPSCGANRNAEPCGCADSADHPSGGDDNPWAALDDLKKSL